MCVDIASKEKLNILLHILETNCLNIEALSWLGSRQNPPLISYFCEESNIFTFYEVKKKKILLYTPLSAFEVRRNPGRDTFIS